MEVARGTDGDGESLTHSEGNLSIWELLQSPQLEVSTEEVEMPEGEGARGEGEKKKEKKDDETSFVGRVKGLFMRSFM